jgi:hypothetical protein
MLPAYGLVISEATVETVGIFDKAKSETQNEAQNDQQNMAQQGGMQATW